MTTPSLLNLLALILIVARTIYWYITEWQAHKLKPKTHNFTATEIIKRGVTTVVFILVLVQLLGLDIWPWSNNLVLQLTGFSAILVATLIGVVARHNIGANWSHAAEYQIKKGHQLVDTGVYRYIRHPIYSSITLSILGTELLVGSQLFFVFMVALPLVSYLQAKQEEALLLKTFGQSYKKYMHKTKMFVPYLV